MLKCLCIVILLSFFSYTTINAQEVSIKGVIKDSIKPLSNVNIIAKPFSKGINLSFFITNMDGEYAVSLQKNETYIITVSYLGYKSYSFETEAIKDEIKDIILSEATEQLDEVIIIEEIPMIVKKDTIIYDTKAFTDGSEYKLKNILEKLPGVEVERNGDVLVNGKKVTKMLVEGNSFFGGNSKLAVENIPANAVDNVEVLDNYSEVSFLKDYVDSDEMAMNITLKEDKKRFTFGDVDSGLGEDQRYETHTGLFYYSPKTNVNFIGDLNDTGKKSFTLDDYINFEGGISKLTEKEGTSRSNSIQNYANLINTRPALNSENKFAGLNITSDINPSFSLSGYGIFSNTNTLSNQEIINNFFFEEDSYVENVSSNQEDNNLVSIAKLSADYTPNFKEKVFFDFQSKYFNNQRIEERLADIENLTTDFINERGAKGVEFTQDFEWHKKFSSRHITSLVLRNQYSNTTPDNFWNTNRSIVPSLIPFIEEERFNIVQNIDFVNHSFDILGKHYWVLNSKNHLYTTFGNNYLNQEYTTEDFQILENGIINSFENAEFNNNLNFKLNDFYVGLHYKFKANIFTVKTGGHVHYYNWRTDQVSRSSNNKFVFLPDFTTKLEINSSENLTFRYRFLSNFTDAPNYANGFRLLDYNQVFRGNTNLENEIYQNGIIRYYKFAMYNGLIINGVIDYKRKNNFIRNNIKVVGIDQFLTPALQEIPETTVSTVFNLRKRIKKLQFKFNTRFQYATFQKNINGFTSKDETFDYTLQATVRTRFKKLPNIELGLRSNVSFYNSGEIDTNFATYTPVGKIEYTFLKEFTFLFNYEYTKFQNRTNNVSTTFTIADFSLFYKINNSPLGLEIKGSNLFNTEFRQKNTATNFLTSSQKDFIIPRILMFSLHYKL